MFKKIVLFSCLVFGAVYFSGQAFAEPDNQKINLELKSIVLDNFAGFESENIGMVLKTVHTQSPGYLATKQATSEIFPAFDLKYELTDFHFITIDGDYAIARAVQKTTKVSGPAFRNNILDLLLVFRKEGGEWKFWSQLVLGLQFI